MRDFNYRAGGLRSGSPGSQARCSSLRTSNRAVTGSHRKFRIAFENLHLKLRRFAIFPETGSSSNAIAESATIGTVAALDGTGNAYEFCLEEFAGYADDRIAVASHIDEGKMRRQIRIRESARLRDVAALAVLDTGAHAVTKQQVHRRLRSVIVRALSHVERPQRMIFRQTVL